MFLSPLYGTWHDSSHGSSARFMDAAPLHELSQSQRAIHCSATRRRSDTLAGCHLIVHCRHDTTHVHAYASLLLRRWHNWEIFEAIVDDDVEEVGKRRVQVQLVDGDPCTATECITTVQL